jgi:hypothetical protein
MAARSDGRCRARAARSRRSGWRANRAGQPLLRLDLARLHKAVAELWQPFDEAGQPDEGWDELIAGVDSLRPLASEALLALFKLHMTTQLQNAFGKVIERQAKRK